MASVERLTRFAPTPNGYLHLGNFYNLIWITLFARNRGAGVGLRIDDYDQARYRSHFVDSIFATLERAGFAWTVGPTSTEEFKREFSSRHRVDSYRAAELELKKSDQVYWCTCTRKLEAGNKIYSGRCRSASHTEDSVSEDGLAAQLRFCVSGDELKSNIGDVIVVPRDGELSYHVASIVDDTHFGFDLLVRGQDLLPSSLAQVQLAKHMGCSEFATRTEFVHHALIRGTQGEKLSKSQQASPVLELLETPGGLQNILQNFARSELGITDSSSCPDTLSEFAQRYAGII
jgi:glutamyl/glutaminyl-tRNA synthetase